MKFVYSELRKKGLLFATIISVLILLHLIGVYIYEGGSSMGVRGGSVNIGLIGKSPDIPNPLEYTQDKYHDLILKFLFRSLISFDPIKGEYQGNIGTCDIRDLARISCEIKENQFWSDGTKIQVEDIIGTYQAFRVNVRDEKMLTFLKNVSFVSKGTNTIEITAKEKNSLILDLLTYPIVRSDMLERIKTGRISPEGYITSGPYKLSETAKDEEHGYDRITIERDEKNGGQGWLDKYNFLFFTNSASLERATDILSIIVPSIKNEKIPLGPRFGEYIYTMYEYFGLFMNTDTLSSDIRKQVYGKIEESFSGKIDTNEKAIANIFNINYTPNPLKLERNLSDVMRNIGYTKPDEQISTLNQQTGLLTGSSIEYGNTKYFKSPTNKKIYFSEVVGGSIVLSGDVPANIAKVYINGYELKEYIAGNTKFTYRVSTENTTLVNGKNTYLLELETADGKKDIGDTLIIYYANDGASLAGMKKLVDDEYLQVLNNSEKVLERQSKIRQEIERLKALDPRYYYNTKSEPYEVKIAYNDDPLSLNTYAIAVSSALESLSIKSELVPISSQDIEKMIKETGSKDYDFLIVGFNAVSRLSRIGQVFLSSEADLGRNFAKIESKKLDGLFASLRIAGVKEETEKIEKDILDYIRAEAFFLPISSPYHTLYIDKNLKGVKTLDLFQDISTLHTVLETASIKDTYVLTTEGKGFGDFIRWIFDKATP